MHFWPSNACFHESKPMLSANRISLNFRLRGRRLDRTRSWMSAALPAKQSRHSATLFPVRCPLPFRSTCPSAYNKAIALSPSSLYLNSPYPLHVNPAITPWPRPRKRQCSPPRRRPSMRPKSPTGSPPPRPARARATSPP